MMYAELIGNYEKQRIKSLCGNKCLCRIWPQDPGSRGMGQGAFHDDHIGTGTGEDCPQGVGKQNQKIFRGMTEMINSLIEAISVALGAEFGEGYEIHMEEIEQGLKEPCFFIFCLNPTNDLFLGKRYFRTNQFCIHYFPLSEAGRIRECNDVAERMLRCLEYIEADGDDKPIMGTRMKYKVDGGILNFFVNYDCFTKAEQLQTPMDGLESSISVKGGG